MKKGIFLALLVWVPLCLAVVAHAQYLRCRGKLVTEGDLKFDVINKCGEPALKETRVKEREVQIFDPVRKVFRSVTRTVYVDEWTYNFGPHRFLYVVVFEDGRVVSIQHTRDYGY